MGKRLGQHFLINKAAIQKIIAALDLRNGDTVIEIGPGRGELTIPLAEKCQNFKCQIIGVEKDPKLGDRVRGLGYSENLEVHIGDALKILPEFTKRYTLRPKPYKIVGNIPYYITGKLLRIISELDNKPSLAVLTLQKEVAERITAIPPRMNLLAAAVQIWAKPQIIAKLPPADFDPPPKVESAIIKLETRIMNYESRQKRGSPEAAGILGNYYKFIKVIFKQPRKTLLNNVSDGLEIVKNDALIILKSLGFDEKTRPQELEIEQIVRLSSLLITSGD